MCLYIKSIIKIDKNGDPKPYIAKKDKTVYKVVERKDITSKKYILTTPHIGTLVKIGQVMKAEFSFSFDFYGISVKEGIHAHRTKESALRAVDYPNEFIIEATIPKGARYFIGTTEDIVATKMKLKRILYKGKELYKRRKGGNKRDKKTLF